jgi:hypothetical protein
MLDGLHGPANRCVADELDHIEAALDTFLPSAYREFMLNHGPIFTPYLWEAIVQRELATHPVREFLSPQLVISDNPMCWGGGMPTNLVGFAGDFMGGLFGFPRTARIGQRPDDLPVQLFDADYVKVVPIAESFDNWLLWIVENVGEITPNAIN